MNMLNHFRGKMPCRWWKSTFAFSDLDQSRRGKHSRGLSEGVSMHQLCLWFNCAVTSGEDYIHMPTHNCYCSVSQCTQKINALSVFVARVEGRTGNPQMISTRVLSENQWPIALKGRWDGMISAYAVSKRQCDLWAFETPLASLKVK